ncbi:MAG: aminodeoxychorismate lyase [Candidatus Dactylopiibacterium carminicum]|uniref:Endolytic murein transglycosylase n=1 Tax=Candidatus Dactylopiibacterium carminicum TaxID=857335 RepID=A0A272EU12_9RHOO|nr:endolytic transglycosylase MltG [Candidatus Dactylopiibacterium carminicum]KAF7599683.1 endolytic transglycosylase MltG [Candidatus Dactylopiibacterium carminicum]PAS93591.1 MAG: aminodeoxychorismate lyase [Candidatus Dactylopiibacterium carminicum]PAS97468.1 MAG: aminodeoxychorismate lyase [Candidatus Dactylopiibacterium carminicum]PAS99685.1 MAG: aminodeoxychorismate lyase [Candidatus Dactylopiibacterium carminicum]
MFRKILTRLFFLFVLLPAVVTGALAWQATRPLAMKQVVVEFDVARGDSMRTVARTVAHAGLDVWPPALTWLARVSGHASQVKAGSYRVDKPVSAWELVLLLSSGANAYSDVTLVEGWTFARVREVLYAQPDLLHDTRRLSDGQIMERLGMTGVPPEGMFAPDTYSFSRGSSELEILHRASQRMQRWLDEEWAARQLDLPLASPYEALILASVVEKETGQAGDRSLVSSVFHNRLRIGMRLQSDPTVIYGLGQTFKGSLSRSHLQADTPYNSYTRAGLPPTPIALVGRAALRATLQPEKTSYMYFVARGDGSSQFSRTLDEHNRAVSRYLRNGR